MSLAGDWAHGAFLSALDAGVCDDLVLVVADCCLCDRADVLRARLQHVGVVGGKNGGSGANNGAEGIIELLGLGLLDSRLEGWA